MTSGPVFVYRLRVTLPEGSEAPGWHPEGWEPAIFGEDDVQEFRWPTRRHCLSVATARRWKQRLEGWGATVVIERSLPVSWETVNA